MNAKLCNGKTMKRERCVNGEEPIASLKGLSKAPPPQPACLNASVCVQEQLKEHVSSSV